MAYKVDFEAADVQWQIEVLKHFPEIAHKRFLPAMNRSVADLRKEIEPNIPVRSGVGKSAFQDKVSGKGLNLKGRVGFGPQGWYMNIVEYGARAHGMGYIPNLKVRIDMHPGMAPRKFMEQGFARTKGRIDQEMAQAADQVVQDLAVK